jgi:hypothetical protein
MAKKIILILFFNIFVFKTGCLALDFNDNNLVIPSIKSNLQNQDVQEIINKTQQLESKVESERNSLKNLVDEKKAEYLEAKTKFKNADKQLKAVRSVTKKLQKNF